MSQADHSARALFGWACFLAGYIATYSGLLPGVCWEVVSGDWTFNPTEGAPVMRLYGVLLNGLIAGGLGHLLGRSWRQCPTGLMTKLSVATLSLTLLSWLFVLACEVQHWMLPAS